MFLKNWNDSLLCHETEQQKSHDIKKRHHFFMKLTGNYSQCLIPELARYSFY